MAATSKATSHSMKADSMITLPSAAWTFARSRALVLSSPPRAALRPPRVGRRARPPGPPRSSDVARQRIPWRLSMLGVQVDLILSAVHGEVDGAFGLAAIQVIDEQDLYLLGQG
jgi:hypothetical protein